MLGERSGKRFRLGDRLRVKLVRADLESGRIDFILAQEKKEGPAGDDEVVTWRKNTTGKPALGAAAPQGKPRAGSGGGKPGKSAPGGKAGGPGQGGHRGKSPAAAKTGAPKRSGKGGAKGGSKSASRGGANNGGRKGR